VIINTLKVSGTGYIVNGDTQVDAEFADDATNTAVSDWLETNTAEVEFTDAELSVYTDKLYQHQRAEAYPSLDEQADMAYWDRQNGTTTLDDAITAVKEAHPKPTGE